MIELEDWIDASVRPPEGECIVWLEEPRCFSQMHTAKFDKVNTIAGYFAFDMPKVLYWMPRPPPPQIKEPNHVP